MHVVSLIRKKRDGGAHTEAELRYLITEMVEGRLESYQLAAWLMAVWFRGMNDDETEYLTAAMVESGDQVDLSSIPGVTVDKHSTGGVGDGTTLIVAPVVAAAGGRVAKMSGRGLGHTGGTLDKLESIPGMRVAIAGDEFLAQVRRIGLAVISQTGKLVPADKTMYALRDVTATVDSIPLIASSVMSKKLACGAQAILLDVKFGHGAFMKEYDQARLMAQAMVSIGNRRGRKVRAALSSMQQPLGTHIGNALEVKETIEILQGQRADNDLARVASSLAAELICLAGLATTREEGLTRAQELIRDGHALDKLRLMIEAQGGDPRVVEDTGLLPTAPEEVVVKTARGGYLHQMHAETIGHAAMLLGAGRARKEDAIDPAVGLVVEARVGELLEEGQPLATLKVRDRANLEQAVALIHEAAILGETPVPAEPLIREFIG